MGLSHLCYLFPILGLERVDGNANTNSEGERRLGGTRCGIVDNKLALHGRSLRLPNCFHRFGTR